MRRAALVALPPALAVAYAWTRLEATPEVWQTGAMVVLGVGPIFGRATGRRVATVVIGLALAASLAFSSWPGGEGDWPGESLSEAEKGLRDFYVIALPFDPGAHQAMHGLVLLAVFAFTAVLALAATGRRPLVCSAAAAVGVCWPVTIALDRDTIALGALALGAALWPPLATRASRWRGFAPALVTLVAVVVVASAAADAGLRPSESAIAWQRWTLFGGSSTAAGVKLVWDANYAGIQFPASRTTVLQIRAPRRSLYWRASTLDSLAGDRWIEDLYPAAIGNARRLLPADSLQPPGARRGRNWVEQRVEVRALVSDHVIAASEPMRVDSTDVARVVYFDGGVMRASRLLAKGQEYTVWSAAPRSTPAQLVQSPARYPDGARRYLELDRTVAPAFGVLDRARQVDSLFGDVRYAALWPYKGVWRRAQAVAGDVKTPYEATIAIERWLRTQGGFRYEEQPPQPAGLPPLADFVERTKQGYCQHFAGAMALMLRLLGVPARVAVGFTSGTWKDGVWTVTDHDAHAWVEVWFAGHGWLTFDPTPGRGRLSATYTNASDSADVLRALGTGRFFDFSDPGQLGSASDSTTSPTAGSRPPLWPYLAVLAGIALVLGGLAAVKEWRRRRAYHGSDPRRRATAARRELAAFLRDQGVAVGDEVGVGSLRQELERLGVGSDRFVAAFARARYGPPQGASVAAAETRRELGTVLRALRARLGMGRRARGFLALHSLRRA